MEELANQIVNHYYSLEDCGCSSLADTMEEAAEVGDQHTHEVFSASILWLIQILMDSGNTLGTEVIEAIVSHRLEQISRPPCHHNP